MIAVVHALVIAAAFATNTPGPDCGPDLASGTWAFAPRVAALATNVDLRGEDVAGLVALSTNDVIHLLTYGELESPVERAFFPFVDHPLVRYHLDEHPAVVWNEEAPDLQAPAAANHAWDLTMKDHLYARVAGRKTTPLVDEDQMDALLLFLRPDDAAASYVPVTLDQIAEMPKVMDVYVPKPRRLKAKISRDLARRLDLGPDTADLQRWNNLRTVAELFDVAWNGGPAGPTLDRAVAAHFGAIPTRAGFVVGLRPGALVNVAWSHRDWPVLSRLSLDDVTGVVGNGEAERRLLERLATNPKR